MRQTLAGMLLAIGLVAAPAAADELLTNGDFESGSLAGWTVTDLAGGSGTWSFDTPGTTTPFSPFPTAANPAGGSGYAVSHQGGPGTHALSQGFTVAPGSHVTLSYDLFVNDWDSGPFIDSSGLDHNGAPNQHGRVDILSSGAGAFDTGAGVIGNFYLGTDSGNNPNPYTSYTYDITSYVGGGGTFTLRFAEVDNQAWFNMGVDNVSIRTRPVPEPASLLLFSVAFGGTIALRRRRRKAAAAAKRAC